MTIARWLDLENNFPALNLKIYKEAQYWVSIRF